MQQRIGEQSSPALNEQLSPVLSPVHHRKKVESLSSVSKNKKIDTKMMSDSQFIMKPIWIKDSLLDIYSKVSNVKCNGKVHCKIINKSCIFIYAMKKKETLIYTLIIDSLN